MKTIFIDCTSGVSGDMLVGALLDLGADFETLSKGLSSLGLKGLKVESKYVDKHNKSVCDYNVIITNETSISSINLHGVLSVIDKSSLSNRIKDLSRRIFTIAAEAGAEAHGISIEQYFFHEKGALDSFADIVGACICIDALDIGKVYVSKLHDGYGFITYSKGKLPVPVPAVKKIVEKYRLNLKSTSIEGELVTPTGASIIAAIKSSEPTPNDYKIVKTGFGNGKRKYNPDGFLRIYQIE